MREKNSEIKPCKYEKKVWRRNAVAYLHKKLSSDEEDKIEHIYFNLQKENNIEFSKRFTDEGGFIDKKLSKMSLLKIHIIMII